jgi:WD40 repeat protein
MSLNPVCSRMGTMRKNGLPKLTIALTFLFAVFSGDANGQISSYRLRELFVPRLSEFTQHHPGIVTGFDLSPDGSMLAVEFATREPEHTGGSWVALWDVDRKELLKSKQVDGDIPDVPWYMKKIRFSPDGQKLVVLTGPSLLTLSFPDLKTLFSTQERVRPEDSKKRMFLEGFSIAANRLAVLRQYNLNSGHNASMVVEIVDLETGERLANWSRPGLTRSIALSPDAHLLALTINPPPWGVKRNIPAERANVFILNPNSGDVIRAINSNSAAGNAEFLGDGKYLITVPDLSPFEPDDSVKVWTVRGGELQGKIEYPRYGLRGDISTSRDGPLLAVASLWLNPTDVRIDRDNPRGGSLLLLSTLPGGHVVYKSRQLGREYRIGGYPPSMMIGFPWPVLVRMSASGRRVAIGGEVISINSIIHEKI